MKKIFAILFILLVLSLALVSCNQESHEHQLVDGKKLDSTCTTEGYLIKECECGYSEVEIIKLKDHEFGEWEVTTVETCTVNGVNSRKCKHCDHTETEKIDAHHVWGEGVVTEPTCETEGYTTYTCTVEGCDGSKQEEVKAALGHKAGEAQNENINFEVTCTTDATYESVVYCTVCSKELSRDLIVIIEKHHQVDDESVEVYDVVDPTCTVDGYINVTCTACDYTAVRPGASATGHDTTTNSETLLAPTCIAKGVVAFWCPCGHVGHAYVDMLPHNYSTETVVHPTETEAGYTKHTCDTLGCEDFYIDNLVSSIGLDFEEGVVSYGDCVETVVIVPFNKDGVDLVAIANKGFINAGVTEIYLTSNITVIGDAAFAYSNLKTIYYIGTEEQWNAIEKGTNWDLGIEYEVVFVKTTPVVPDVE